jgi:ribosomal-protein-alanine N-acetyltransferase
LIREENSEEILQFEIENREFFESRLPKRSPDYYALESVRRISREIEEDHEKDIAHMYLIRNEAGELVGRLNLFDIERGIFQTAEIGYRIAEKHNGKKYMTKAIALGVQEAFERYGLRRLEAYTAPDNIGSQVALIKNGFQFEGRIKENICVNGQWSDSLLLALINKNWTEQ